MTTPPRSYGTNFRRAEEASNAQGTVQAALDFALQNAKKNPTPENIAIAKDTAAARQATIAATPKPSAREKQPTTEELVNEANAAVADAEAAIASARAVTDSGSTTKSVEELIKQYTSDVLNKMSQEEKTAERLSAYNILRMEFEQYGLGSLVTDIRDLLINDTPTSEFGLRLRGTDAYKTRFKANEARIAAGLSALSPAEYVALEDQYQNIMRQYGLPANYYTKGEMGRQEGFEKFIANDISAVELEDRIQTAQNRVINASPEISRALKEFYPDITNGDILAYTLDPKNAIKNIQRKVTAAEIGGAAMGQGLQTSVSRAEELAAAGIDKAAAQQGFQTVAEVAPRGSMLSDIYRQGPYGQTQAEQEVFNLAGSAEAARQRKKLTSLETAAFSGQAGVGALARERAGNL